MELKHVLSGRARIGAHVFLSEVPTSHCLPGKIEIRHRRGHWGLESVSREWQLQGSSVFLRLV